MRKEDIDDIVALHARWLATGGKDGRQANLENADLRQAELRGANLEGMSLARANLERADLAGARLTNADLRMANLGYANLEGSDLAGANLQQAIAMGADFTAANVSGAILLNGRFDHACFRNANLTGALARQGVFYRADLSGAVLDRADLSHAALRFANLSGATLGSAMLEGAVLNDALFTSEQGQKLVVAAIQNEQIKAEIEEEEEQEEEIRIEDFWVEPTDIVASRSGLKNLAALTQKVSLAIAVASLACVVVAGVIDLYGMISAGSLAASTGFRYFGALFIAALAAVLSFAAAHVHLRLMEGLATPGLAGVSAETAAAQAGEALPSAPATTGGE